TGPDEESTAKYGSMLTEAPAEAGRNFTSELAHGEYRARVADGRPGVDPWRTTRNLLASQPMAFNLFGPLVDDRNRDLATAVLRQIVPDVDQVTLGDIERPSDALGDRTAFDVYFEYRRNDGTTACIAIETKLSEPFSQKAYDWNHYLGSPGFDPAVWTTADPGALGNLRWSQLWRNHLLARAESARRGFDEPTVLVVHHPQDLACVKTVNGYRQLLRDRDRCRSVDVATVLDAVRTASEPTGVPEWVEEFADRYLRFGLSAPLAKLHGMRYEGDARRAGLV
ncbi:MAG: PGN_0703 family putative restriction endonuclease, partial [Actinomycetota bacterium]